MKRLGSPVMPICPSSTDEETGVLYGGVMEDEELSGGLMVEKKRRLSVDQVRALEKNFEVENKLEPERKVKLAEELGLQPRQVAVWFQNRRARWKTKQLEKDYGVLKATYDSLKLSFDKLHHDNQSLLKEIGELKSKLNEDSSSETQKRAIKEDQGMVSDTEDTQKTNLDDQTPISGHNSEDPSFGQPQQQQIPVSMFFADNGSSDSDSSAILNEDSSNNNNSHSPTAAVSSFLRGSKNSSSMGFHGGKVLDAVERSCYDQTHELVKIEEQDFFGEEESCSGLMFAEDQAPSLRHWYSSGEWN